MVANSATINNSQDLQTTWLCCHCLHRWTEVRPNPRYHAPVAIEIVGKVKKIRNKNVDTDTKPSTNLQLGQGPV